MSGVTHEWFCQDSPRGSNLVTLTDTTAQAVMQEDGSIYCQPDTLFEGSYITVSAALLDWRSSTVTSDLLSGLELPGINYKFNSKKYRFFYGSRVEVSPCPYKVKTSNIKLIGNWPQVSWPPGVLRQTGSLWPGWRVPVTPCDHDSK